MKLNSALMLSLITFTLSLNAWIQVKNDTNEKIKIVLDLISCPTKDYVLDAGETKKLYSGLGQTDFCAMRGFRVYRSIKGTWVQQTVYKGYINEVDFAMMSSVLGATVVLSPLIAVRTAGEKGQFVIKKVGNQLYVVTLSTSII